MHAESERRHNKDDRHSSLEKYNCHFIWKGCVWEGVGDGTELQHIDPHSYGHNSVSFLFSWATQPGAWGTASLGAGFLYRILSLTATAQSGTWGPTLLGADFLYRILSPTDWTSCAPSYIIVRRLLFLWVSQIAIIQPVHGQCYILIFLDRMHLLFTLVHFLFWQPSRVEDQYTPKRWLEIIWNTEAYL